MVGDAGSFRIGASAVPPSNTFTFANAGIYFDPGGRTLYVHVISPVVPDADYSITNLVYEVVTDPMERLNFYNTYRSALKQALFVIQGPITVDLAK